MSFHIDATVEIPYGSMYKYEIEKGTGILKVDRPLPRPLPYNYGFVPNTLHGDGDPLDVCIIGMNPIFPLTNVKVVLLGAFKCVDNGESDDKLVCAVVGEAHSKEFVDSALKEIQHYLSTYKSGFEVLDYLSQEEAYKIVMKDLDTYMNE